jgi:phthiocerol/phenolphthiocerol synthesis type-I polyketide synthase E
MTDIFTAFAQRLAGDPITLQPATTSWLDWSQRCAALSTHPAILGSREFWLENAARTTLQVGTPDMTSAPADDDLATVASVLSGELTAVLDEAQRTLRRPADEILLAALGRTIAHTIGEGVVAVDVAGHGRLVLKPDVDLHRTVGWFTTIYPVSLDCATAARSNATEVLDDVHRTIDAVPHYGIGHGLLRYVYAPTARQLGAVPHADVFFSYLGTIPDLPVAEGPVQLDMDAAMPAREMLPGLGHALELRVYRTAGLLHLDWWYDIRRLQPSEVKMLAEHFPVALTELTREAVASRGQDGETTSEYEELALVDLSALDS